MNAPVLDQTVGDPRVHDLVDAFERVGGFGDGALDIAFVGERARHGQRAGGQFGRDRRRRREQCDPRARIDEPARDTERERMMARDEHTTIWSRTVGAIDRPR